MHTNIQEFVSGMKRRASFYEILCESVGKSCNFLDLELFLPSTFGELGKVGFKPFTKLTAQKIPLTHLSQHNPDIAWSWPIAEVERLFKLSYNRVEFEFARREKVRFFELHFLHDEVVRLVRKHEPGSAVQPKLSGAKSQRSFWLVVPHHKHVYRSIKQVLSTHTQNWRDRGLTLSFPPRVSWKNSGSSVACIAGKLKCGVEGR